MLDDGRLTDGSGRTVDFRNAILILTSNLGSRAVGDFSLTPQQRAAAVMDAVRGANFKPEFINRLDELVIFNSLKPERDLVSIVEIQLDRLRRTGWPTDGSRSRSALPARAWLAGHGYDPAYGARPLRRLIQSAIDAAGGQLLGGEIRDGDVVPVNVSADGDSLVLG